MGKYVLTNCGFWVQEHNISGYANSGEMTLSSDAIESTTYNSESAVTDRTYLPGLKGFNASISGFQEPQSVDALLYGEFAVDNAIITVAPESKAIGSIAYFGYGMEAEYKAAEGAIGNMAAFSASMQGDGPVRRGNIIEWVTETDASYNSTPYEVGAVGADEYVYAVLHVSAITATNVIFKLQSDVDADFNSPIDQITFTTVTAAAVELKSLAGAITDTFWRINAERTGGSTVSFAVVMAIA